MNQYQLQQILSIYVPLLSPLATLAIVMVGFIHNNSRLNDFRGNFSELRASMNDMRDMLRAEIRASHAELKALIEKNHSEVMARIGRLEDERRLVH